MNDEDTQMVALRESIKSAVKEKIGDASELTLVDLKLNDECLKDLKPIIEMILPESTGESDSHSRKEFKQNYTLMPIKTYKFIEETYTLMRTLLKQYNSRSVETMTYSINLVRYESALKKFERMPELKDQISERPNQVRISYNHSFIATSSKNTALSRISGDDNFELWVGQVGHNPEALKRVENDKGHAPHAKLDLLEDSLALQFKVKYRAKDEWVFDQTVNLLEVFSYVNPENLKHEIVSPVFAILAMEFSKEYISFYDDEIELKFYFQLDYEFRLKLAEKTTSYLKQVVEKKQHMSAAKEQLSRLNNIFRSNIVAGEGNRLIVKSVVGREDCTPRDICGINKCYLI